MPRFPELSFQPAFTWCKPAAQVEAAPRGSSAAACLQSSTNSDRSRSAGLFRSLTIGLVIGSVIRTKNLARATCRSQGVLSLVAWGRVMPADLHRLDSAARRRRLPSTFACRRRSANGRHYLEPGSQVYRSMNFFLMRESQDARSRSERFRHCEHRLPEGWPIGQPPGRG